MQEEAIILQEVVQDTDQSLGVEELDWEEYY
jgi:hypothetical protein